MNNIEDCFYRVSVKALIYNDDRTKILLFQEKGGEWELPGGGLEFGASPHEEIRRELLEESGLVTSYISSAPTNFTTSVHDKFGYWISNLIYEVKLESLDFTPKKECVAIKFFSPAEILEINSFTNTKRLAEQLLL